MSKTPDPAILERLDKHGPECAIAAPVWHELTYGCRRLPKGKRRAALEAYLRDVVHGSFPILPYDEAAGPGTAKRGRGSKRWVDRRRSSTARSRRSLTCTVLWWQPQTSWISSASEGCESRTGPSARRVSRPRRRDVCHSVPIGVRPRLVKSQIAPCLQSISCCKSTEQTLSTVVLPASLVG